MKRKRAQTNNFKKLNSKEFRIAIITLLGLLTIIVLGIFFGIFMSFMTFIVE